MTAARMTETELGALVVAWLRLSGWKVFQEVKPSGGPICDVVATSGPRVWCIELKTSLGLGVVEQALGWLPFATEVSVGVPSKKTGPRWTRSERLLFSSTGLGLLRIARPASPIIPERLGGSPLVPSVQEPHRPRFNRKPPFRKDLLDVLATFPEDYCRAGATSSETRWTPWRATVEAALDFVAENRLCTIAQIVEALEGRHHYRSNRAARVNLYQGIRSRIVPGLRFVDRLHAGRVIKGGKGGIPKSEAQGRARVLVDLDKEEATRRALA